MRDMNEVTLISIQKTTGNGVTVEYGYLKEFAFDVPTALRRLADKIESQPKTPSQLLDASWEELELGVRAYNAIKNQHHDSIGVWDMPTVGQALAMRHPIKNLGRVTFWEINGVLVRFGITTTELWGSPWWKTAPEGWRVLAPINWRQPAAPE